MSAPTSQTGFTPPDPEHLARLFPSYDIVRLIACGGMGAVYEAVQRSLDRSVAIKILPSEFTADETFRNAFESEAKAMARLNHPNLIGVYDFGEVEGMLFIIMEYVPGLSLFNRVNDQPLAPPEAARLLAGVSRGLAHAHENGIIHRDIKPANILLDSHNQPKIGDFGLARPLESKIREGEEIFGTPGYTAPEVLQNPQGIDHRADIFSLGVVVHEMLTGKLPSEDPRPASAISQCDPRFDALVRKATQPNPAARHKNAAELAAELDAIASAGGRRILQTAAARRPAVIPRTRTVATKSSSTGPVVAALLFAILGVGGLIWFLNQTSPPPQIQTDFTDTDTSGIQTEAPAPSTHTNSDTSQTTETRPDPPESDTPREIPMPDPDSEADPVAEGEDEKNEIDLPDGTRVIHWNGATSEWTQREDEFSDFEIHSGTIPATRDNAAFRHVPWSGDGVFTLALPELTHGGPEARAGLMLRESLEDNARHVFIARSPEEGTALLTRTATSGTTTTSAAARTDHTFLRVVRSGDTVTASISGDGESWQILGESITLPGLPADVWVGFAAWSNHGEEQRPLRGSVNTLDSRDLEPEDPAEVEEFFTRARNIMSERCAPAIEEYKTAIEANADTFDRDFRRLIRRIDTRFRDPANERLERLRNDIAGNNHRIPPTIDEQLNLISGSNEVHEDALARQMEIDEKLAKALAEESEVYLIGLERQVERFVGDHRLAAAEAVRREMARTADDPHHLGKLMMEHYPLDEEPAARPERRRRWDLRNR